MSENCIQTFAENTDLEIEVNDENSILSRCQYQWVAHWTQASNKLSPQGNKTSSFPAAEGQTSYTSEQLQVRNNRSEKLKMLSIGVNHESPSANKNIHIYDLNEFEFKIDSHQPADDVGDKEIYKADKSLSHKSFDQCDTELVLSHTQSLTGLPAFNCEDNGACCSVHSEDVSSEWIQFPLFGVNQKVRSTLESRERPGHEQRSVAFSSRLPLGDTPFDTQIIKVTTKKHNLEVGEMKTRVAQERQSLKFIKSRQPCLHDDTGSTLHIFSDKFKCPKAIVGPRTRGKEKICCEDSDCVCYDHLPKAGTSNLKRGSCDHCSHPRWKPCEMEDGNDLTADELRRLWSRVKAELIEVRRNYVSGGLPCSSFGRDNDDILPSDFTGSRQPICKASHGLRKLDVPECANQTINKVPNRYIHDAETKLKLATDMAGHKSISKKGRELPTREKTIADPTCSSKSGGIAFFEMLTVTRPHIKQHASSQISDTDSVSKFETSTAGTSRSPVRTDTMSIGSYGTLKSQQVALSRKLKKIPLVCYLVNSNTALASIKPPCLASPVAMLPDDNTNKKESISSDQALYHVQSPHASNSVRVKHNKWVKRLRPKTSDSLGIKRLKAGDSSSDGELHHLEKHSSDSWGKKRLKVGDGPSIGEPHQHFTEVAKPNISSSSMMKCLKEQEMFDVTKQSENNPSNCPRVSPKELNIWIGRWCKKIPQTIHSQARGAASVIIGTESSKVLSDSYEERQFPSIAALALMGKAMNNIRTREFQRRGSSVVWNTEGLL